MAIIKCPECKKEVSDEAGKCVHCGYPIKKNKVSPYVTIAMILLIGAIIYFYNNPLTLDSKKEEKVDSYYINKLIAEIKKEKDGVSDMNCYVTTLTDERVKVTCSYKYKKTYHDINYCSYDNVIMSSCTRIVNNTESKIYKEDE